jgi:hypothetical protein
MTVLAERLFMSSIKSSLVGLVLAGILAIVPAAVFAHDGGGGGGGHFGGYVGHGFAPLPQLPAFDAEKIDSRDFAIDTCYPTQHEITLAEARARRFWAKHSSRFGAEPRFLAVETSKIFPGEVQNLYPKLIYSETTASFFSHGDHTQ